MKDGTDEIFNQVTQNYNMVNELDFMFEKREFLQQSFEMVQQGLLSKVRTHTFFKLVIIVGICVIQFQFLTKYFKKVKISV
jgi:hypothetical protein